MPKCFNVIWLGRLLSAVCAMIDAVSDKNHNGRPLISIVIATSNAGKQLERCLLSIVSQRFKDLEIVVQDNNSTDQTSSIVKDFIARDEASISWQTVSDSGISDAWNRAIRRASGEWILFLGADDELADHKILSKVSVALKGVYPQYLVAYGRVTLCADDGSVLSVLGRDWQACARDFRSCLEVIPHQGTFHHKSLFHKHGLFDTGLMIRGDFDYLLRELALYDAYFIENLLVSRMAFGGISTSREYAYRVSAETIILYRRHVRKLIPMRLFWDSGKAFAISTLYRIGGNRLAIDCANFYRKWFRLKEPICY